MLSITPYRTEHATTYHQAVRRDKNSSCNTGCRGGKRGLRALNALLQCGISHVVVPEVDERAAGDGDDVPRRMEAQRDYCRFEGGNVQALSINCIPNSHLGNDTHVADTRQRQRQWANCVRKRWEMYQPRWANKTRFAQVDISVGAGCPVSASRRGQLIPLRREVHLKKKT